MAGGLTLFIIGLAGILALVTVRLFEERRGERVFKDTRERLDTAVAGAWRVMVLGDIPHHFRKQLARALRHSAHALMLLLASLLRTLERPLTRASRRMRAPRHLAEQARDPSPFLKDIGTEKKGDGTPPPDSV